MIDCPMNQYGNFQSSFEPSYWEQLDAGETESFAILVNREEPYKLCATDAIVPKVLSNMGRADQSIRAKGHTTFNHVTLAPVT